MRAPGASEMTATKPRGAEGTPIDGSSRTDNHRTPIPDTSMLTPPRKAHKVQSRS